MPLFFELSALLMTFTLAANLRITSLNSLPVTSLNPIWWDWVILAPADIILFEVTYVETI